MSDKEEWKGVPDREDEYQVSTHGRVYSVPRQITMKDGRIRPVGGKILTPIKTGNGYWMVKLGARQREYIHRLVAKAFLGDMGDGYEVNHKDENHDNNSLDNLEWMTKPENLSYGTRMERSGRAGKKRSRAIAAIKDGITAMTFSSIHDAQRAGYSRSAIAKCIQGKAIQHKGFAWKLITEMEVYE